LNVIDKTISKKIVSLPEEEGRLKTEDESLGTKLLDAEAVNYIPKCESGNK